MFRDREKALEELEKQLLEEEDEEEEYEDEYEEEEEQIPSPRKPFDFDAYNTDISDTDLEEYSEEVYAPRRKTGCAFWLLFFAAALLAVAYFLAKKEGLL